MTRRQSALLRPKARSPRLSPFAAATALACASAAAMAMLMFLRALPHSRLPLFSSPPPFVLYLSCSPLYSECPLLFYFCHSLSVPCRSFPFSPSSVLGLLWARFRRSALRLRSARDIRCKISVPTERCSRNNTGGSNVHRNYSLTSARIVV